MRNIAGPAGQPRGRPARMLAWLKRILRVGADPSAAGARGAEGERLAAAYLRGRPGFEIVARNWRNPRDQREEIDLVCRDAGVLVFVEVKSRPATALVRGFLAVDRRKRRVLRRAIHAYLTRLHPRPPAFRFDVVEVVTRPPAPPEVLHFPNVPLFPKGYRVDR
jgi:putative endonuclease